MHIHISASEALILGRCLTHYLQSSDDEGGKSFLTALVKFVRPYSPQLLVPATEIRPAECLPQAMRWYKADGMEFGYSPNERNVAFTKSGDIIHCLIFREIRRSLAELIAQVVEPYCAHSMAHRYDLVIDDSYVENWFNVTSRLAAGMHDDVFKVVGVESPYQVERTILELIDRNGDLCRVAFDTGRILGKGFAICERFAAWLLEDRADARVSRSNDSFGPHVWFREFNECIQELKEKRLATGSLAEILFDSFPHGFLHVSCGEGTVVPFENAWNGLQGGYGALMFALGELLAEYRTNEPLRKGMSDGQLRSLQVSRTSDPLKIKETLRRIETESLKGESFTAEQIVRLLGWAPEAISVHVWPNAKGPGLKDFLVKKAHYGTDTEKRLAQLTLTLRTNYRNPVEHEAATTALTMTEAWLFVVGIKTLLLYADKFERS
jgi:hypothetical protein